MFKFDIISTLIASTFLIANAFAFVPTDKQATKNQNQQDPIARAIACAGAGCGGGDKLCATVTGKAEFTVKVFVAGAEVTYYCYMES